MNRDGGQILVSTLQSCEKSVGVLKNKWKRYPKSQSYTNCDQNCMKKKKSNMACKS